MNSLEINKKQSLNKEEKEKFFQHLESNSGFFKETLEILLTLVVSDPKLTYQVADLIESDYRDLYLVIMKKVISEKKASDKASCCRDL